MPFDLDEWDTSLPDWEERIMEGRSLFPDLPLIEAGAKKAVAILRSFRMPDMPGMPTFGEVGEDWQFDLVEAVFGSFDPESYTRAISEFFVLIPKKNGKTPLAASIMLVALILNDRPDAEYYLISETQKIALRSFNFARGIIRADPKLDALFHVNDQQKEIRHLVTGARLMVLSADAGIVTGGKGSGILVDELHVLGAKDKADTIMAELRGGFAARPEGFLITITTQSAKEPVGLFKRELMRARAVRDGTEREPLLPILYEYPREVAKSEGWRDPATWRLVNPNLGVSVDEAYLRSAYRKAVADGPAALALFASLHLNVEIGMGLHSERWRGADYWPSCADPALGLEELVERSEVAVIGVDMGGADDLASLGVIGRERETGHWLVWARAWCFPQVLEQRQEIAPKLRELEEAGELVISPRSEDHVAEMAQLAADIRERRVLPGEASIGLDPYGVAALLAALQAKEFSANEFYGVGQGFKLNGAIKGLERRLLDRTIWHGGGGLLTWAVSNAKAESKGNNVLITKARAGVAKIDPLMALFNAAVLMDLGPVAAGGPSFWEAVA